MKSPNNCQHKQIKKSTVSKDLPIAGQIISAVDIPITTCLDCGEIYYEGRFLLELEKKILAQK